MTEAACTHSGRNPATGTELYDDDDFLNTLVETSAPNGGALNTVGALCFDVDEFVGFEISTSATGIAAGLALLGLRRRKALPIKGLVA